jgi:C-5 cytosine-specific DNA methylase/winged helix-turn-helix protein
MNQQKIEQLTERILNETLSAMSCLNLYLGHRLNLFQSIVESGHISSAELSNKTKYSERYLREWLECITVLGYIAEYGPGLKPYNTLRDVIGEMDEPVKGDYYNKDDWPFFYISRNRRACWDSVSFTIQSIGRHIPIHPRCPLMVRAGKDKFKFGGKKKIYRRLSTRECARIQTFPDSFQFAGGLKSRYRLIGNAVPPLFARKIAESIKTIELSGFNKDAAETSGSRQHVIRQKVALMVQRKQKRPSMAQRI